MKKYYTIQEVAEMVNMTPNYIYILTRRGEIGHYKIGNSVRIDEEQLQAWLQSKRVYNKSEVSQQAEAYAI